MTQIIKIFILANIVLSGVLSLSAQTKIRKPKPAKPAAQTAPTPEKKNERPAEADAAPPVTAAPADQKKNNRSDSATAPTPAINFTPTYFYEFSQPNFTVSQIKITHDAQGRGEISFMKKNYEEAVKDPLIVSETALKKINDALDALDFFNSTASYQYEKDYSHLGNIKLKVSRDGKTRETAYNYTTDPNAKILSDEYRKISNQYIWLFDISIARQNQPLETPQMMDTLDSLMRRSEISDPEQMLPALKKLSDDERIPLIARNHAARLVQKIEKPK